MSQQHPSNCIGTVHGKRRLRSWNHKPPGLGGSQEGLTPKPFTLAQAPRVSTFGFPERVKKVTQQSKAAPNLTAAAPGPPHLSCRASGHRHRRLRPRNKRVGRTTGSGPLGRKQSQCTPNWRTLSGLPELPSTRIL